MCKCSAKFLKPRNGYTRNPNLQNIPIRTEEGRRVREALVAAAGSYIMSTDYSQIELCIMAHLSEDALAGYLRNAGHQLVNNKKVQLDANPLLKKIIVIKEVQV